MNGQYANIVKIERIQNERWYKQVRTLCQKECIEQKNRRLEITRQIVSTDYDVMD
jgi:hypothetical protein